jgi:flagellin-specific chaperone FliS
MIRSGLMICIFEKIIQQNNRKLIFIKEKNNAKTVDKLNELDDIITDALDKSENLEESQTLRWVLDKISELS